MVLNSEDRRVDADVGTRLRSRRLELRLSQSDVGRALAVSFQQVQKYEAGKDRLSPSKILTLCGLLEVEPAFFFLATRSEMTPSRADEPMLRAISDDQDWTRLNKAFRRIASPSLRRKIVVFISGVADANQVEPPR